MLIQDSIIYHFDQEHNRECFYLLYNILATSVLETGIHSRKTFIHVFFIHVCRVSQKLTVI